MPRMFVFSLLLASSSFSLMASVDPQLLAMAPPESTVLTGIDVTRAQSGKFGQFVMGQINSQDANFQTFVTASGFDPRRDLQQILFAAVAGKDGPDSKFLVMARGAFDTARIRSVASTKGWSAATGESVPMLVQNSGEKRLAVAFPIPGIAVMGDLATFREVIQHGAAAATIDPKLLEEANRVGTDNDIWFATILSGRFLGQEVFRAKSDNMGSSQAFESIIRSAGGMQFGDTNTISLHFVTRSAEDARSVSDVLKLMSNLVQMQGNSASATVATALNHMQLQTDDVTVNASLSLSETQLEQIVQSTVR